MLFSCVIGYQPTVSIKPVGALFVDDQKGETRGNPGPIIVPNMKTP